MWKEKEKGRKENVLRYKKKKLYVDKWKRCNENIDYFGRKVQSWWRNIGCYLGA